METPKLNSMATWHEHNQFHLVACNLLHSSHFSSLLLSVSKKKIEFQHYFGVSEKYRLICWSANSFHRSICHIWQKHLIHTQTWMEYGLHEQWIHCCLLNVKYLLSFEHKSAEKLVEAKSIKPFPHPVDKLSFGSILKNWFSVHTEASCQDGWLATGQ